MIYTLNATEKDLLKDLDRIIDWHLSSGKLCESLLLSKRQAAAFKRIAKKSKGDECRFYNEFGEVDIKFKGGIRDQSEYRGVKLSAKEERKRCSAKRLMKLAL